MKTKIRLAIHLKLFLNTRPILSTTKQIKSRILVAALKEKWDMAYLRVNYGRRMFNYGFYSSPTELKKAISIFTEKSLINYLLQGKLR